MPLRPGALSLTSRVRAKRVEYFINIIPNDRLTDFIVKIDPFCITFFQASPELSDLAILKVRTLCILTVDSSLL